MNNQVLAQASIQPQAAQRIRNGYPWIFSQQVDHWQGQCQPGELVKVLDLDGQTLGFAYAHPEAKLCLRMLYTPAAGVRGGGIPNEPEEFTRKLNRARSRRLEMKLDSNAWRLVWSEADGLPGLICDDYHDFYVVQFLTIGMEQRRQLVLDWLISQAKPRGIFERSDGHGRELEGLPARVGWAWSPGGVAPEPLTEIQEGPLKFQVHFDAGHKTGFYLDQRAARRRLRACPLAGSRVLDGFAFSGGFSLSAAWAHAREVVSLDSSAPALAQLTTNAQLNHLQDKITTQQADVFKYLPEAVRRKEHFKAVILDPPPFARTQSGLADAMRGHRELHRRAAQLLEPHGWLLTCSCSHRVGRQELLASAKQGAHAANRTLAVQEIFGPDADHPEKSQIPESRYLTCLLARVR